MFRHPILKQVQLLTSDLTLGGNFVVGSESISKIQSVL